MTEKSSIHWSFWVIAVVALVWNGLGAANYLMQMDAATVATYPESHQALINGRPIWATSAFAVAVFGGMLGCVLLLLRKSWAYYVFIASLLGIVIQLIHSLFMVDAFGLFSPAEIFLTAFLPLAGAVFLVWYARHTQAKGWIS